MAEHLIADRNLYRNAAGDLVEEGSLDAQVMAVKANQPVPASLVDAYEKQAAKPANKQAKRPTDKQAKPPAKKADG